MRMIARLVGTALLVTITLGCSGSTSGVADAGSDVVAEVVADVVTADIGADRPPADTAEELGLDALPDVELDTQPAQPDTQPDAAQMDFLPDSGLPDIAGETAKDAATGPETATDVPPDVCQPACGAKDCGDDGCGGSCGECGQDELCSPEGQCLGNYPESCLGTGMPSASTCPDGLGYEGCCDLDGRLTWCQDGQLFCIACKENDPPDDSCGWLAGDGYYDCGGTGADGSGSFPISCPWECTPECSGKECGDDGCSGSCGTCNGVQDECVDGSCVCLPACEGKECGDDGCGGSCGACDDGNLCTDDSCASLTGACTFANNKLPCDDGSVCTADDTCSEGACSGINVVDCDDGTGCTFDLCDPVVGDCWNMWACDDSDPCTDDSCEETTGVCIHQIACDDENVCTDDSCDPIDGSCFHAAVLCSDGIDCTQDGCDSPGGCYNTLKPGWCLIDGACIPEGEQEALDPCVVCQPATDAAGWTTLPHGTVCGPAKVCLWGQCVDDCTQPGPEACPWPDAIVDPDFDGLPGGWTTTMASLSGGALSFDSGGLCGGASATQTIELSAADPSKPLVLHATVEKSGMALDGCYMGWGMPTPGIFAGGAWTPLAVDCNQGIQDLWICPGPAWFGGAVNVSLVPDALTVKHCLGKNYSNWEQARLSHLSLEPAPPGLCPVEDLGNVVNGDFEDGLDGWVSKGYGNPSPVVDVQADGGPDGSPALRVYGGSVCGGSQVNGSVTVPLANEMKRPALQIRWKDSGSSGIYLRMFGILGPYKWDQKLEGTGAWVTRRFCIPPWYAGGTLPITLYFAAGGGACSTPSGSTWLVDELSVVSEPGCPDGELAPDGSFELSAAPPAGVVTHWSMTSEGKGSAEVIVDPGLAFDGERLLRMQQWGPCGEASVAGLFQAPEAIEGGGPALVYRYRYLNKGASKVYPWNDYTQSPGATPNWTERVICLPPFGGGLIHPFWIRMSAGPGTCADSYAPEAFLVDGIEATTRPECPWQ